MTPTDLELALEQLLMWCIVGLLAAVVAAVIYALVVLTAPDPEPPDWVNDGRDDQ